MGVMTPEISVVIPTRNRAKYLDVALVSLAVQPPGIDYEVIVVDDGSTDATAEIVARHRVRLVSSPGRGLNSGRNAGAAASSAPLIAFLDDDVRVDPGWLAALRDGAAHYPEAGVFGGPIRAVFEGPAPTSCGRERPPITTLELGPLDQPAEMVWGSNFAVRRSVFERLGGFDEGIGGHTAGEDWLHGDEEDWLLAYRRAGGEIVYLGAAAVEHRRVGDDARLRALARAGYHRGRYARVSDVRRGTAPSLAHEVRVVAGCAYHTVRRRCPQGIIMGATALGRLAESVRGTRRA
jgi:glycosyltransferase involved in cell wall biosynthesis